MLSQSTTSEYLPPLGACLDGEKLLLSWNDAYLALHALQTAELQPSGNQTNAHGPFYDNARLKQFFSDDETRDALSHPLQPFSGPNAQSKRSFESVTAPINVTPSDFSKQLVEDSRWLSELVKIDEISALRICIVGWQRNLETQLSTGLTEEEAVGITDAWKGSTFGPSNAFLNSSVIGDARKTVENGGREDTTAEDSWRKRLLRLYLAERNAIIKITILLLGLAVISDPDTPTWIMDASKVVASSQDFSVQKVAPDPRKPTPDFTGKALTALADKLIFLQSGCSWKLVEDDAEFQRFWCSHEVVFIVHMLELLLIHIVHGSHALLVKDVTRWFDIMASCEFFVNFEPPVNQPTISVFQLLVASLSLAMLQPLKTSQEMRAIAQDAVNHQPPQNLKELYCLDSACVRALNETIQTASTFGASPATPAVFAWALLAFDLQSLKKQLDDIFDEDMQLLEDGAVGRKVSASANRTATNIFEESLAIILEDSTEEDDSIERLAMRGLSDGNLFGLIPSLMQIADSAYASESDHVLWSAIHTSSLQLLSLSSSFVQYGPEVLVAALSILGDADSQNALDPRHQIQKAGIAHAFITDEGVRTILLDQAFMRFPLEAAPALRLARTLLQSHDSAEQEPPILERLSHLRHFTQQIPLDFRDWEYKEDENAVVRGLLGQNLPLFFSLVDRALTWKDNTLPLSDSADEMYLPAGTQGYLSNPGHTPEIFMWEYEYNAAQYLQKLLSTVTIDSGFVDSATCQAAPISDACEIIALLSAHLHYLAAVNRDFEAAAQFLAPAASASGSDQDLSSLIFSIFDGQLQNNITQPESSLAIDFFSNCVGFITELVGVSPGRVWSYLGRSRFLELQGNSVNVATVILNFETLLGRYQLLASTIKLLDALVEEVISSATLSVTPAKALTRFGSVRSADITVPIKSKGTILTTLVKVLAAVLESIYNWNFSDPTEQVLINLSLVRVIEKIVVSCYGFDDVSNGKCNTSEILLPAAKYIVDYFLSASDNEIPLLPLLNNLALGLRTATSTVYVKDFELNVAQTRASLSLSTTLMRISLYLRKPTSKLEKLLLKASPVLARLYARLHVCRLPVLELLTALVENSGLETESPPSLLGTLGTQTAKAFVRLLSDRIRSPLTQDSEIGYWNFFTSVIENSQQWLSIFLLTGKTPRESLKATKDEQATKSVLDTALDKLQDVELVTPSQTIAVLKFISATQSHAPWALQQLTDRYKALKQVLVQMLSDMQFTDKRDAAQEMGLTLRIAALITEILAIDMHGARRRGEPIDNKALFPDLHLLRKHGVETILYNRSLHQSLERNVESRFAGVKLSQFKRTSVIGAALGPDYVYDLTAAGKILGKDKSWKPNERRGYFAEFTAANINLSLVEAQIELLNSWRLLALELSISTTNDDNWTGALVDVAADCLRANIESNLPETLFQRLKFVRVDFAFAILQRLVDTKSKHARTLTLVNVAWDAICAAVSDFDDAFSSSNADYYRALLRVLFLTLQFHLNPTNSLNKKIGELGLAVNTAPLLFEVLDRVVTKGFRSVANQLHDADRDHTSTTPSDLVLITAILQKVLLIPSIRTVEEDIASAFATHGTARYATTLFSWADRLSAADHDPVYGELSILFLLELSTVPLVAEHLAVEGVLSQLNNAPIIEHLRRPNGIGPFDAPPRLHSIWTRGILPLCLNLLHAVGAPIAAEVATFLNGFPGQLARASNALSGRLAPTIAQPNIGRITLGMASEVHSLALLSLLLDRFRAFGPADGIMAADIPQLEWDKSAVREDVEGWVRGRRALRERVVPGTEREREMLVQMNGEESRLEARIVGELKGALECVSNGN